jgi:uncharacterized protein YegP (UPF0339 family)
MSYFEVYQDVRGGFRWRLKAANGEIVAVSESYTTASNARRSAERVKVIAPTSKVLP